MPPFKPFASTAQQRKLHVLASEGKISAEDIHGKDEATKHVPGGYAALPAHVGHAIRALHSATHASRPSGRPKGT